MGPVDPGAAGPGRGAGPAYLPPEPASRTAYEPGELAQCTVVPAGHGAGGLREARKPAQLPVLTMITGYAGWLSAVLLPTRTAADLFAGWWQLIAGLGAVPKALVWTGGRDRPVGAGRVELTAGCQAFRGTLGAKVIVCKPADPEAKGLVERAHDWLERSFLPGRMLAGRADFNAQLAMWLGLASTRPRRALGCSPAERIAADKAAMLALPPVAPETGWRMLTRLARDHYVRLDSNDYSVHPAVIGRRIEVTADLARVRVLCDGQVVADHERSWAWHQSFTDPAHRAAADALRRQRVAVLRRPAEPEVQVRALADSTRRSGPAGAWRDGGPDRRPRHRCGDRVLDPGAEGPHAAGVGAPAGRAGPDRILES